jgi:hypothetical protein
MESKLPFSPPVRGSFLAAADGTLEVGAEETSDA